MRTACVLFAVSAALSIPALAADADGRLNVLSLGIKSCEEVVADHRSDSVGKLMNSVWVAGYVTAINAEVFDGFDVAEGTDSGIRDKYVFDYCRDNTSHTLFSATASLVEVMKARYR